MADTGWRTPTATHASDQVTNPNNGWTDNGSYGTSSNDAAYAQYDGYSFGLSAGDTIDGIEVNLNAKESAAGDDWEFEVKVTNGQFDSGDSGYKTTGTVESAGTWSNFTTTRLNSSDDSRATTTSSTYVAGEISDFNFGIPADSVIEGITAQAEFSTSYGGAGYTAYIRLSLSWDDGTSWTATKEDSNDLAVDATKTYGGAADTWGRTWSVSDFADGTFRVKVEGKNAFSGWQCRLDYFQIKVHYTTLSSAETTTEPGTSDTDLPTGGAANTWGLTWDASSIDTDFGVNVDWGTGAANAGNLSLDATEVRITYTPAAAGIASQRLLIGHGA